MPFVQHNISYIIKKYLLIPVMFVFHNQYAVTGLEDRRLLNIVSVVCSNCFLYYTTADLCQCAVDQCEYPQLHALLCHICLCYSLVMEDCMSLFGLQNKFQLLWYQLAVWFMFSDPVTQTFPKPFQCLLTVYGGLLGQHCQISCGFNQKSNLSNTGAKIRDQHFINLSKIRKLGKFTSSSQ